MQENSLIWSISIPY